jgi:Ser/Thr protein kinase RdoA (MazF antagonist)
VCQQYRALSRRAAEPLGTGLINDTFLVHGADGPVVLQRVHPIFAPSVHDDIEAVTSRLQAKGVRTPKLIRTDAGALWLFDEHQRVWRAMTFVRGVALDKADSPERVREAAKLVAQWHQALAGWEYEYAHVRAGVHDTHRHLRVLERAVADTPEHRLHAAVSALAQPLLDAARSLPSFSDAPRIHAHGDLKLSNLLFEADSGAGVCLVDLDTVARMPWAFEMGDALRSWCNPRGENVTEATVDRALFEAALVGYREGATKGVDPRWAEWAAQGLATIALELAARFLGDAIEEKYFGFDAKKYPARGEHNLVRGRGQWSLALDAIAHQSELVEIARRALGLR